MYSGHLKLPDREKPSRIIRGVIIWGLLFILPPSCLFAALPASGIEARYPQVRQFFPDADRFGPVEGEAPAAPVYRNGAIVGYVLRTQDIAPIPAYSGKPVNVLVGIDLEGRITGAEVIEHHEPILLVGIPEQRLFDFTRQHVGKSITDRIEVGGREAEGSVSLDAISGATVTVKVVNRSIMRAARRVAEERGILETGADTAAVQARVREELYQPADWVQLTGDGSIRRLLIEREEVEAAFGGTAGEGRGISTGQPECLPGEPCGTFIDLYYTYLNPPMVGRNLLGQREYERLMADLGEGGHAIALMANGIYSFKGSGYVRGGIFDRIQVVQGDQTILFRDTDYQRLMDPELEGMPEFGEKEIFIIREGYDFDPGRPWQLELLVRRQVGALESVFTTFTAEYETPEAYIVRPAPAGPAPEAGIWQSIWADRALDIAILGVLLAGLTLILIFQDALARRARLLVVLRTGFLLLTLLVIGWLFRGQLSVVNTFTFVNALRGEFRWETFLTDPVLFILWTYVAATLLLWGRGVYCGWLCPFGAMQKLANMAAQRLHVPQLKLPAAVHERLWAVKYLILLGLFGISLQSLATAEVYAEVEPFKTAVTLRFQREWTYIAYALALVLISAFNCKFYCKYLCPLGAALAVPARLRIFDWLKRHKECGRPCQVCANECEIQAIDPIGRINVNECHYCLDCQVTYWDAHKCPPMVERRKRREKAPEARAAAERMEAALGGVRPVTMGKESS
ncbi:transcriptional regulator NosR [Thioalbus denitrificans]|uniref:transcriptional regulator NosR n=1 Tax=Thioalbus denitrificans TaxID=547122 RepID=UPI000DF28B2C